MIQLDATRWDLIKLSIHLIHSIYSIQSTYSICRMLSVHFQHSKVIFRFHRIIQDLESKLTTVFSNSSAFVLGVPLRQSLRDRTAEVEQLESFGSNEQSTNSKHKKFATQNQYSKL